MCGCLAPGPSLLLLRRRASSISMPSRLAAALPGLRAPQQVPQHRLPSSEDGTQALGRFCAQPQLHLSAVAAAAAPPCAAAAASACWTPGASASPSLTQMSS